MGRGYSEINKNDVSCGKSVVSLTHLTRQFLTKFLKVATDSNVILLQNLLANIKEKKVATDFTDVHGSMRK